MNAYMYQLKETHYQQDPREQNSVKFKTEYMMIFIENTCELSSAKCQLFCNGLNVLAYLVFDAEYYQFMNF